MRTKIFYTFIFFTFFGINFLHSETPICEPDCPETPFIRQYPLSYTFTYMGCTYRADYYIRKACGIYCDILLWRVVCLSPPPCDQVPVQQMLNIAAAAIIMRYIYDENASQEWRNITGGDVCLPEPPSNCSFWWRVSKSLCWHWWYGSTSGNPILSYCDYELCCLTWYRVCYDQFGQPVVTEVESNANGTCPYDPNNDCVQTCD